MWYRISARGLIRYEDAANKMAAIIFPVLKASYQKHKGQIKALKKEYFDLNEKLETHSKTYTKPLLDDYIRKVNIVQNSIENDATNAFNSARFILNNTDLDNDFDIFIKLDFSSEWKGAYYNKEFYLSFLDIESEKDLAETIEHELVHNKQFKEYGKTFTEKKLRRVQKTPYFDLKYEMPALATNVLRELPTLSDYINDKFNVFKSSNPWADFENFAVDEISSLLNNSRNFQTFLLQSEWFNVLMYGDEDRQPIQKQYNKNKLIKILHEAISRQAENIL
jgi:hypothetical protein